MALESGTTLGPYEIVGLIGAGGMGEVYRESGLQESPAPQVGGLERRATRADAFA